MKNILKCLIISVIIVTFMFGINKTSVAENTQSEIVIEKESGRILHQKNCEVTRAMASTTKILTCITAIDFFDVDKEIKIEKDWTLVEGSSAYLKEGEVYSVYELLYGLMLRSGNDCALSIACGLSGCVENFVALMNELAKLSGAKNSSFKNPHGLDQSNHYTTAYDLAMITRYALSNEIFQKIVSLKSAVIGRGEYKRTIYNKNKLLKNYQYATGVKTGYTKNAGRCLVSSSNKGGFELISVVLNCGPMFERSEELLEQAYSDYNKVKIVDKDISVGEILGDNDSPIPLYCNCDFYYPLAKNEEQFIEKVIKCDKNSKNRLNFNQECGTIEIFFKKHLIFIEKIYTILE